MANYIALFHQIPTPAAIRHARIVKLAPALELRPVVAEALVRRAVVPVEVDVLEVPLRDAHLGEVVHLRGDTKGSKIGNKLGPNGIAVMGQMRIITASRCDLYLSRRLKEP